MTDADHGRITADGVASMRSFIGTTRTMRPVIEGALLSVTAGLHSVEHAQRRGAVPRRVADVAVGDSLGRLVKGPLTVTNMVGWLIGWGNYMVQTNRMLHLYLAEHPGAALRGESTGIDDSIEAAHWDVELARLSGMPTGYDLGSQRVAWLAHLLTDWCGDDGALVDLDVRIRKPNLLGDVTWIDGEVTGVRQTDDGPLVDCELAPRTSATR